MRCANTDECFEQIGAYFSGERTGYFLLVNTESYSVYQELLQRVQADGGKTCVYVSEHCYPNGLPDADSAIFPCIGEGSYALIGLSQALMLQSAEELEEKLDEVLGRSISGHGIVLLDHCEQVLQKFIRRDIRVENRVVLVDGAVSALPRIRIAKSEDECIAAHPVQGFRKLVKCLEGYPETQEEYSSEITVTSTIPASMFSHAVYSMTEAASIYQAVTGKYADLAGATEQSYGSDSQWKWLAAEMKGHDNFSSLSCEFFGTSVNLSLRIKDVMETSEPQRKWLLWLAMKVFGERNNQYLTMVLNRCGSVDSFEEHLYMDIIEIEISEPDFDRIYSERKHLLLQLPENLPLTAKYCEKLGRRLKESIFYLTDNSDIEKYHFVRCLSIYDYTEGEIYRAVCGMSRALSLYMRDYSFEASSTRLPKGDEAFRTELTTYFKEYKNQKLTNRVTPDFLDRVDQYAVSRPYNKLSPRSSIVSHTDKKNTQLFFFDALGVEYLSFILAKCEEYGMVSEVTVGRCELPSITTKNKEFFQYFDGENIKKIDKLDEIKHHSQVYNYQKCEYPLHIFEELEVIDEELRKIQSLLVQGVMERALIVSDHGASRLAVRYGREVNADIELDESGEHSGRCCPVDTDPMLPFAAYENGFSVLANYERFKGGRRANVEVHGGASLEEALVPIIVLSKRPENIEICFVNPIITLKPRIEPELILYSNIPLHKPRLLIDGAYYDGEFVADRKHARFAVPKIKRKGNYTASVYDGEKNMSISLEFTAQKQTREVNLL